VELAASQELKRDELELCTPWKHYAVWSRGRDLVIFVDAIVHLLFLGVCKTMAMPVEVWCSGRGKRNGCEVFCQSFLPLVKRLGLDY
jgi:hypothetical protein